MTIAILATGDEIIHGDTLNTNTHAIAHALNSEGLLLGHQLTSSDREQDIFSCITFLCKRHSIIILTGGLGPTSDDRTRYALARFLNVPLVEFSDAVKHIEKRLTKANITLNAGNRQQALFPLGATLLPNPHGTAMGCSYYFKDKLLILLPGPPRECLPMFNHYVLPMLGRVQHTDKHLLKWRLFGVAEGEIAQILDDSLASIDCETGYRLETPYLEFKVRCSAEYVEKVQQIIEPIVAPLIIAPPEQKASERLQKVIGEIQISMVIIDDVTGGILQTLIQRPSNYPWLSFHEQNNSRLHVHLSGLEAYWSDSGVASTSLTIDYQYDTTQGTETQQIPYRSPLVVEYAAEWISFRLLHLINQLKLLG